MGFDFDAAVRAPHRMQPGLRRLHAQAPQLTPIAPGSRHQREKLAVLGAFPQLALQCRPGFDPQPALHALAARAAAEHPHWFAWDGERALSLGTAVGADAAAEVEQLGGGSFGSGDELARCLRGLPAPWRLAALLALAFVEDLAIIDSGDGALVWTAVCLPSHWAPAQKIGLRFAEVHAPVADGQRLRESAAQILALMAGGERFERFVWTVSGHPRLHAHPRHVDPARWAPDIAATLPMGAWWRIERQTLGALPGLAQTLFTIEVDSCPLAQAITSTAQAARLHDALASMSPAVLEYRALHAVHQALLQWLRSVH